MGAHRRLGLSVSDCALRDRHAAAERVGQLVAGILDGVPGSISGVRPRLRRLGLRCLCVCSFGRSDNSH